MFKVNNKNTITMPLWCFYCNSWTYFTPFYYVLPSVSIVDLEQVNDSLDGFKYHNRQSIKPQKKTAGVCKFWHIWMGILSLMRNTKNRFQTILYCAT